MKIFKLTQNQIKSKFYFKHFIPSKMSKISNLYGQICSRYHVFEQGDILRCDMWPVTLSNTRSQSICATPTFLIFYALRKIALNMVVFRYPFDWIVEVIFCVWWFETLRIFYNQNTLIFTLCVILNSFQFVYPD